MEQEVAGDVTIKHNGVKCAHCGRSIPKKDLDAGTARPITITLNDVAAQKVLCAPCSRWLDSGNQRFIEGKIQGTAWLEGVIDSELATWESFADDAKTELLRLRLTELKSRLQDLREGLMRERGV